MFRLLYHTLYGYCCTFQVVHDVPRFDLQEVNNLVAGGGVSIYYSHALQLIFFSYSQGNSLEFFIDLSIYVHIHVHKCVSFKECHFGLSSYECYFDYSCR